MPTSQRQERRVQPDVDAYGTFRLVPNPRVLGPRLGKDVQSVIKAAKAGEWVSQPDGSVEVGGQVLQPNEFDLALDPREGYAAAALPGNQAVIVLDTELTPELEAEGLARDLVRAVQQARKDADLNVADRIRLELNLGDQRAALEPHLDWAAASVLATEVDLDSQTAALEPPSATPASPSPSLGSERHRCRRRYPRRRADGAVTLLSAAEPARATVIVVVVVVEEPFEGDVGLGVVASGPT
ncbi:MAG: DUF5915 domain-containing protein [Acidimicrobiales bacterium]